MNQVHAKVPQVNKLSLPIKSMKHYGTPSPKPARLPRLTVLALAAVTSLLPSRSIAQEEDVPPQLDTGGWVTPSFFKDSNGATWATWPTIPGWQYSVETSSDLDPWPDPVTGEPGFTPLADGFSLAPVRRIIIT